MIRRFKKPISTRPILTLVPNLSPTASATFLPMKLCTDGVCVSIAIDMTNPQTSHIETLKNLLILVTLTIMKYKITSFS